MGKFARRVAAVLAEHPELSSAIAPLLSARAALESSLARLDEEVAARARERPACRLLMTAPGVGPVTAFAATLDDPGRFPESRAVSAYLGLTSRRYQSGEMAYSGRISKYGDAMLRGLLYEAANAMLTVVRRAHPLKAWARKLKKRSGHKKACVALARKLAVVLHRMLMSGEAFRWPEIGIGGCLAAPPLPHHRAYGSVPGGSVDYAALGWVREGRPSDRKKTFGRAMARAGLLLSRHGPWALPAVFAARCLPTPRRRNAANRTLPRFHCFQTTQRRRRLIHQSSLRKTAGVSQKPK